MTQSPKTIKQWIAAVNEEGRDLNSWELGFMESLTEQFDLNGRITERQEEILEHIYAEKTP